MPYQNSEITEILRMIEGEHLDIRTVTMGISLRGITGRDLDRTCADLREHVLSRSRRLVSTIGGGQRGVGGGITNRRL